MERGSKIVSGRSLAEMPQRLDDALAGDSAEGQASFRRAAVARIARIAAIGAMWATRKVALWTARSRVAPLAATLISPLDRRRAILLKGAVSQIRYRNEHHAQFWAAAARSYPFDPAILRMRIHSALRSGDGEDADTALGRLIASQNTHAGDARFVVGLTNIDLHGDRSVRIRSRIKCFLASLRGSPDYRIAAVRVCRIVFAHFPRVRSSAHHIRARFAHMLDRSSVSREPKRLLRRVAACEVHLDALYPGCLFDTDILPQQRHAFVALVRNRVHERRPFSFVRIGDGEAACLPYETSLSPFAAPDARDRERIWWGKPLDPRLRSRIYPRLARAMFDADCIGIPTVSRFLRELRLQRQDRLETTLTGRGLRAILHCAENWMNLRSPGMAPPVFTSCHLHQDLELWDCYGELLEGTNEVFIVSCHVDLPDCLNKRFGVKVAGHVLLPPDRVTGSHLRAGTGEHMLPTIIDSAIDSLGDLPGGCLVLVGAGLLGKLIVVEARLRGGVALDVGSIFDHWLGLKTRSYLDLNTA